MISPKRILHICNLNLFRHGQSYYSTDWKIRNGLIQNGHHVYDFCYRDVARWENPFRTTKLGINRMNRRLFETIGRYAPELILFGHCELVHPDTIAKIRSDNPHIAMAQWYVDSIVFDDKRKQLAERSKLMDMVLLTTGGALLASLKSERNRVAFFPNMVDGGIESYRNHEIDDLPIDFLFCGRDYNSARTERIKRVVEGLPQFKTETWGCLGNPPLTGHDFYRKLSQATSSLNLSHVEDVPFCTSGRMTQLLGNGLLTFTPETPGMRTLFSPEEVVYYESDDDLLEKIHYYLEHQKELKTIAAAGWQKAHGSYNVKRVTQFMMEAIYDQPFSDDYEWQNECYR
ncbi:MAG: glycosyltransferase [Proteobacteria bacterium]|nr:glycosyltransferase [Pseudomonadota bacterium]